MTSSMIARIFATHERKNVSCQYRNMTFEQLRTAAHKNTNIFCEIAYELLHFAKGCLFHLDPFLFLPLMKGKHKRESLLADFIELEWQFHEFDYFPFPLK